MIASAAATFSTELHGRNVAWRFGDVGDYVLRSFFFFLLLFIFLGYFI